MQLLDQPKLKHRLKIVVIVKKTKLRKHDSNSLFIYKKNTDETGNQFVFASARSLQKMKMDENQQSISRRRPVSRSANHGTNKIARLN